MSFNIKTIKMFSTAIDRVCSTFAFKGECKFNPEHSKAFTCRPSNAAGLSGTAGFAEIQRSYEVFFVTVARHGSTGCPEITTPF